jgi:hypothetical protein
VLRLSCFVNEISVTLLPPFFAPLHKFLSKIFKHFQTTDQFPPLSMCPLHKVERCTPILSMHIIQMHSAWVHISHWHWSSFTANINILLQS